MKRILCITASVILFVFFCVMFYSSRKTEVFGIETKTSAESISFEGYEITSFDELCSNLERLKNLKHANLGNFRILTDEEEILKEKFPDVSFEYTVYISVCGRAFPADSKKLDLEGVGSFDSDEIIKKLLMFKNLEKVTFGEDALRESELETLKKEVPDVEFSASVIYDICGRSCKSTDTEIDLSGYAVGTDLSEKLKLFPGLSKLDLHRTDVTLDELLKIKSIYPNIKLCADAPLGGTVFSTEVEKIELNFTNVGDFEPFLQTLKLFSNLNRVELCDSNFSNEQMELLCETYPDIKFVWRVHMGKWSVRTDAVAFSVLIADYTHKRLTSEDIQVLKYCTELQALDLGHQAITDISVIGDYLPNLRILILADNRISDLSPLSKLTHLHYLEFFVNRVTDLTPLSSCRELVDLNISYNHSLSDISPILELPLLERLWLEHTAVSRADVELLRKTYPDTKIISVGTGSIDQGWRAHERYRAMIDMFRNDYMSESFSKYDNMVS